MVDPPCNGEDGAREDDDDADLPKQCAVALPPERMLDSHSVAFLGRQTSSRGFRPA